MPSKRSPSNDEDRRDVIVHASRGHFAQSEQGHFERVFSSVAS